MTLVHDWREPSRAIPIVGCGNPWHYTNVHERSAGAAAPLGVPPEAIEWGRELVRQGYRDEHIVTFSETAYGLEHPIRCRPNLIGCQMNEWLATQAAPDEEPGRYVMTWSKSGPKYTPVAGERS